MGRRLIYDRAEIAEKAKRFGLAENTVKRYLREGRTLREPSPKSTTRKRTEEINLSLAVFAQVNPPGINHSLQTIADVCSCEREAIRWIQVRALKKFRKAAQEILKEVKA